MQEPSARITADDMRARIEYLASDRLQGRSTPSPGLELAVEYIESEFRRLGLRAVGGARGYRQVYRLTAGGAGRGRSPAPREVVEASNVVGIVRGQDPERREQFVVVSAHIDGLGVGRAIDGDSIYNGADDNASGTAGLLEIAESLSSSEAAPARSVLFLAVSGEEQGLWGSTWFVHRPPVPLSQIVANINIDMIGRNWEDTIAVIGKPYSSLGATVDSVASANPELGLAVVGDLWPGERFFFRSDHYNFARNGIPAVFFFNGVHEDYHQPSDEPDRIDFEKASRVARLIQEVVLAVANAPDPPRWDPEARAAIVEGTR